MIFKWCSAHINIFIIHTPSPFWILQSADFSPPCRPGDSCSWSTASYLGCYTCTQAWNKWRLQRGKTEQWKEWNNNYLWISLTLVGVLSSNSLFTCGLKIVAFVGMFIEEEVVTWRFFGDSTRKVFHLCWLCAGQTNQLVFSIHFLLKE